MSEPERDRTYLQARVTRPLAVATFERAQPSFARALEAVRARFAERYSEWDGALGADALAAIAALMPADAPLSADLARGLCDLPAAVHARAAAARQGGRGARAGGADRRAQPRQRHPPDLRALLRRVEGQGTGAARPEAEQRMRTIAGEECDAARDRGETGYPAMWEADRVELIEDCVRWLEHEREDELTRALPLVAVEARFGQRMDRREAGLAVADRADRDRAALGHAAAARPDRPGQLGRAAHALPGGRLQDRQEVRREAGRAAGRADAAAAAVRARGREAARDRPGRPARPRTCTRRARASSRPSTGRPRSSPPASADVIALLDAIVTSARRGDFIIAPVRRAPATTARSTAICPGARGDYAERKEGDERLARLATEIRSVQ